MKRILIACAALAAAGCASRPQTFDDLTPPQRQKLLSMQYSADKPNRPYAVLGHVEGEACASNAAQSREEVENKAMEGAMVQAVLLGADGVTTTYCQTGSGADLLSFCNAPVKCSGQAIKFTDQAAEQAPAPAYPAPPPAVVAPAPANPPPAPSDPAAAPSDPAPAPETSP